MKNFNHLERLMVPEGNKERVEMAEQMIRDSESIPVSPFMPKNLPLHWTPVSRWGDGYRYLNMRNGLRVVFTGAFIEDGKTWLHLSVSRAKECPSYEDLCEVKKTFVGEKMWAYQVFAPRTEHINIHQFTLHLWVSVDGPALPNFGKHGTV